MALNSSFGSLSGSPARAMLTLSALGIAAWMTTACGGSDKEADSPTHCPAGTYHNGTACVAANNGGSGYGAAAGAAQGAQGGMAGYGGGDAPPKGGAGGGAPAPAGSSATALDPAASQVVTALLEPLKVQHATPGAQPVGNAVAANFQQGQTFEVPFQAEPGKCYTVIAAGLPTATNVDAQIVAATPIPGMPSAVLAVDKSTGPTAVVGEKPSCYKWALPMAAPLKVIVTMSQGQGPVAIQLYGS